MNVKLDSIILDPALQCRAALNEGVVTEYLEALKLQEVEFPPVQLVRVGEELLLTDGWHRHAAYKRAGRSVIPAEVREGTRRDAILAAIQANRAHGLRRTQADKERAVVALLMDPEWCKGSTRELAALAGVSHVYVGQVRERFGAEKGQVLTSEQRSRVTGEPPPRWQALLKEAEKEYYGQQAGNIFRASSPEVLASLLPQDHAPKSVRACFDERSGELACKPWPWPGDQSAEQRAERCRDLDTVEDLVRAVSSTACTGLLRRSLYKVLKAALNVSTAAHVGDDVLELFADRPRLLHAAQARRAELATAKAKQAETSSNPYHVAQRIEALRADPAAQADALRKCGKDVWACYLRPTSFHAEVRDGAYRELVGDGGPCGLPGCRGWRIGNTDGDCAWCGENLGQAHVDAEKLDTELREILERPGFAVALMGVAVDAHDFALLAAIGQGLQGPDADTVTRWIERAPVAVRDAVRAWFDAPTAEVVLGEPGEEPEEEEEEELDEDGEDLDDGGELAAGGS